MQNQAKSLNTIAAVLSWAPLCILTAYILLLVYAARGSGDWGALFVLILFGFFVIILAVIVMVAAIVVTTIAYTRQNKPIANEGKKYLWIAVAGNLASIAITLFVISKLIIDSSGN